MKCMSPEPLLCFFSDVTQGPFYGAKCKELPKVHPYFDISKNQYLIMLLTNIFN